MTGSTNVLNAVKRSALDGASASDPIAPALWAFAVRLGASPEDAADAVQEALTRLVQQEAAGRHVQNRDAWLYTVVHHQVMDGFRWRGRLRDLTSRLAGLRESRGAYDAPDDPDDEVWAAVDALPKRQRAAVYLRYRADLDFTSISSVLGVTESAARSYVSKALVRLEAILGGSSR
jgi:RNA polymerase sigma factor (sigma-70 family)